MRSALTRLLLLLSVLLMPFGMAPAAAASRPASTSAEMPMGHCSGQDSRHTERGIAECTMACAAALPAAIADPDQVALAASPLDEPTPSRQLHGLHPETATPPPRLA